MTKESKEQKLYILCRELSWSHIRLIVRTDDNPTIGIIFFTDKDETIIKYSVLQKNKPLFASKYRTVLPSEQKLQEELDRKKWIVSERLSLYGAEF